jgi:hypothetical protein
VSRQHASRPPLVRAACFAVLTFLAAHASLGTTATAQGAITIEVGYVGNNQIPITQLFSGYLSFSARVTSVNPVASVTATYAGRVTPLQFNGSSWRGEDWNTTSLSYGPTRIVIRATDTQGAFAEAEVVRVHDNPPAIEILAPEPDSLARPTVRVRARCTDDTGPCRIGVGYSPPPANVLNELDTTVSLDQSFPGEDFVVVSAMDAAGQPSVVRRRIWVEPNQRLSLAATFPGLIQDVDATRALVFTDGTPRQVLMIDRLTGSTQAIFSENPDDPLEEGVLTPFGAMFTTYDNNIVSNLYDWRPGSLVPLGLVRDLEQFVGKMRVEGPWALFMRERDLPSGGWSDELYRRDLRTGAEVMVSSNYRGRTADLASNGDVVFDQPNNYRYDLVRFRDGAFTTLVSGASHLGYARTDGTNVVYLVDFGAAEFCRVRTPDGDELLAEHEDPFGIDVKAFEGWTACRAIFPPEQIWIRDPSGARQLAPAPAGSTIAAIGGDGDLLYDKPPPDYGNDVRRFLVRNNLPPVEIGSAEWPVKRIDGVWYVYAGPHLFRVMAGTQSLLSEGATGPFFDLDIAILNPTSQSASLHTSFLKEGGEQVVRHRIIPPHSRQTIRVDDEPGMSFVSASTVVDSPTPLVVERTMTWDASGYGGHSGAAVDGARRRWLFAEGAQGFFDTFILLVNNGPVTANVRLTFLVEDGTPIVRTVDVGPTARITVYAGHIPGLAWRSFATIVESSAPIAAERAMYFGRSPTWVGGHESAGVSEPATRWFHAEGATGAAFDTYLLLANPGAQPASVVVTFLTESGASVSLPVALSPLSRRTINPENVSPQLANASFATAVQADVPIVSERAMYWSTTGGPWQEAHNSFGVTATGTRWGTADGRVGGARGYQTYLLVANTSTTATATLTITFMRTDGAQITRTYSVGPNRRLSIDCGTVPELANSEFGSVVESTNGVPIVVERATYWNAGGIVWAAGTNVTATPVP